MQQYLHAIGKLKNACLLFLYHHSALAMFAPKMLLSQTGKQSTNNQEVIGALFFICLILSKTFNKYKHPFEYSIGPSDGNAVRYWTPIN